MKEIYDLVAKASSKVGFLTRDEERGLLVKAKKGDGKASSDLFCANSRYLLKTARYYEKAFGISLEDAFDAAVDGYMKAIEKFDLSKQNRLITLAGWWIRYYEQEAICHSHMIAIPRKKLMMLSEKMPRDKGSHEDASLHFMSARFLSLDAPFAGDEDGGTIGDIIESDYGDPCLEMERASMVETVADAMKKNLTERESYILKMNFGMVDGKEHSLSDIARDMGYSKQRINQIKKAAMKKLGGPDVSPALKELIA